jgi:hypothetical protein
MFRNITIRTALTVTIACYTAALVLMIAVSVAGLKAANAALEKMYSGQTVSLRHLAASGDAILQARVDLGAYETLVAQGKPTPVVLARVHAGLADSDRELAAYLAQPPSDAVSAARNVTRIVSEISVASEEQSRGIEQINRAVTQMDNVTQRNAALVEQAAAAAAALQDQAGALDDAVALFRMSASPTARGEQAVTRMVQFRNSGLCPRDAT